MVLTLALTFNGNHDLKWSVRMESEKRHSKTLKKNGANALFNYTSVGCILTLSRQIFCQDNAGLSR